MNILITGGAGFIGSSLAEDLLADGHAVTVVDNFCKFYDPRLKRDNLASISKPFTLCEADVRDRNALNAIFARNQIEFVFHLAGLAGVRPSLDHPQWYIDHNVTGTLHVLDAMKQHGVRDLILASSSSVYGVNAKAPFSEDDVLLGARSPYAASKIAAEHLCASYSHAFGIRARVLRFFTVYGPRQRPDLAIAQFVRKIDNNEPIIQYGEGETVRDYTYVSDLIDGIKRAMRFTPDPFAVFNLGGGRTTSLRELIRAVELALGKRAKIDRQELNPGDMTITCADISKATALLGYANRTSLAEGIAKYVEWYRLRPPLP